MNAQLIQRRSDGAYETPDGYFAVKIRTVAGIKDGMNWFEFKSSMMSPVTRIEWPAGSPFTLLPQAEAKYLVRSGYAVGITDQEMDEYNAAVKAGEGQEAPAVQPQVEQIPTTQIGQPVPSWVKPSDAPPSDEPTPLPQAPQPITPGASAPVAPTPVLKPIPPAT